MKNILFFLMTVFFLANCQFKAPDTYKDNYSLVQGKNHLFKVYTPPHWKNDAELAQKYGIESFFHPNVMVMGPKTDTYWASVYAMGWDKNTKSDTFASFVNAALDRMKSRSEVLDISNVSYTIGNMDKIRETAGYSFHNLPRGYSEDVVFIDTEKTCIQLVFSTGSPKAYFDFREDFVRFVNDFVFLSSDPAEISRILDEDRKARPDQRK
jgi:hypothetical protein